MIEEVESKERHRCDLCNRRIPSTSIKKCVSCDKEICSYCSVSMYRRYRKYPDNGYLIINEVVGRVCVICLRDKLGMTCISNNGSMKEISKKRNFWGGVK